MADTLHLECPGCGETLEVDAGFIGGVCRCAHCGTVMSVDGSPSAGLNAARRPDRPGRRSRPESPGSGSSSAFDDIRTARVHVHDKGPGGRRAAPTKSRSSRSTKTKARNDSGGGFPVALAIAGGVCILVLIAVVGVVVLLGGSGSNNNAGPNGAAPDPATTTPNIAVKAENPWENSGQRGGAGSEPDDPLPIDEGGGLTLSAAWEFNGDAEDSSSRGSPSHGKLTNGAAIIDGRLILDGEDDHVQVAVGPGLNDGLTRLRIDLHFRARNPNQPGAKQVLLDLGGAERGLNIYLYNGRLYCGGYNLPGAPESGWIGAWLQTDAVRANHWHALRIDLDAGNSPTQGALTATLDGEPIGSAVGAKIWPNTSWNGIGATRQSTRFHSGVSNEASPFAGEIDFIRVYRGG